MKFLIFIFFSSFGFIAADNSESISDSPTKIETKICDYNGGDLRCETFDDGGRCEIWIFEDGDTVAEGPDC